MALNISDAIKIYGHPLTSVELAEKLDENDNLSKFRQEFVIPTLKSLSEVTGMYLYPDSNEKSDEECTYLCGNSLGLMPKRSRQLVNEEFDAWGKRGVEGHWNHPYNRPWATVDELVKEPLAHLVGAKPIEVTSMGTLTSNIHSALISFYQPTKERFKILIEKKAFPSDHYAVVSHLHSRGIDPEIGLLTVAPRPGEQTLRTEDIIKTIKEDNQIAVVMLSGVQYYTGQFFEMEKITNAGHEAGCIVGWDLAHAVGNVPLKLHDWDVDFACWCSYKYAGWWGNKKENRFEMLPEFQPSEGASGYQMSNPSILTTISLLGSLQVFEAAGGIEKLRQKSYLITDYLEKLLLTELKKEFDDKLIKILTPNDPEQRGCQLSLEFPEKMMQVFEALQSIGIIVDERKPTVIRVAPAPLYNSYKDVYNFVINLKKIMKQVYAK
ncbi:hypothetical protein G6F38_009586 [Rhizopus arrhizus]|nr:hypothetical protein G6F38_009586 [Rhizopus arrhizus]